MACDLGLEERVLSIFERRGAVVKKKMFGEVAFGQADGLSCRSGHRLRRGFGSVGRVILGDRSHPTGQDGNSAANAGESVATTKWQRPVWNLSETVLTKRVVYN